MYKRENREEREVVGRSVSKVLKESVKSEMKKMNLFLILQFIWIVEFYILAIFSLKKSICNITIIQINEPIIIQNYSQIVLDWMDTYNRYILLMGIILFIAGTSGTVFKYIPYLNNYKLIIQYCDFGIYAGIWLIIISITYAVYAIIGGIFILVPVIISLLCCFIKYLLKN